MKFMLIRFFKEGKGILLINLAVIACLGWVASLWVNLFISEKMVRPPAYTPPKSARSQTMPISADYSVLARKNLFNAAGKTAPKEAAGEIVPATLPLKLVGTIITPNPKNCTAIIENLNEKQQGIYHLGDLAAAGAPITEISRFEVIINNNGRHERIAIDFGESALKAATSAKPAGGMNVAALGEGQVIMDRRYFDAQKSNMNDLMTQLRAIPNTATDGSINGFQVFEIVKDSIYDKIGLKNHDVVQRVNGQPLNSVQTGLDLFNALKNDSHFVLDVVRNKENKSIKVDIQ